MASLHRALLIALCYCVPIHAAPTAAQYSQQLEQLAQQMRHEPLSNTTTTPLPDVVQLQQRFGQPMFFENLGFVEHVCRIDTGQGHCVSPETHSRGDSLFIVTAPTQPYMLVLVSGAAPERTRLYRWDMAKQAELLYDSYRQSQEQCSTAGIEAPIRWVRQLRVQGEQLLMIDEDNAGFEPSRALRFHISANQCQLMATTKA